MKLTYYYLKKQLPELNLKRLTADDFYFVCTSRNCDVSERIQKKPGYYVTNGIENYISLDHRLKELAWLQAAFHEMFHLILHYPCEFNKRKQQIQARIFAIVAMIPITDLPQLLRDYYHLEDTLQFLVRERLDILTYYGY